MNVLLNGKPADLPEGLTVEGLVKQKGLNPDNIIVEHNLNLIKRESWAVTFLREGDKIEILRFVGGG